MKTTRLSRNEFASRSQRSYISTPRKKEAGALRSLEGDRGFLDKPERSVVVSGSDSIGMICAIGFAFCAISIGLFFLVLSFPYIEQLFRHLLGMRR